MTERTENEVAVTVPTSWMAGFAAVGAAVGLGAAFAVGPAVTWLLELVDAAPGPLRVVAALPAAAAIPLLCLVGAGLGLAAARQWRKDGGVTTVSPEGVTVRRDGGQQHIDRGRVSGAFLDGHDLVLLDRRTVELLRSKTDQALAGRLHAAFEAFDYPWRGTADPHENEYAAWVDGTGPLDARAHDLLRIRQRALRDAQPGAADHALDELRALGISVRDRRDGQQYRVAPAD